MELVPLIEALSHPAAYARISATGAHVDAVEVRQTHISAVFLAGPYVYKVKKPLSLQFLDYSTLERRRFYCEEEVRLNRRLAPTCYLGIVPITRRGGGVEVEGEGDVVEWAVKMVRLPAEATLREWLRRGQLSVERVEEFARRLAAFHARAEHGSAIAACGRFEMVAGNARENFEQASRHVGTTVSRTVFDRLRDLTESILVDLKPLIEQRAARGVPRDGHGDLRLDHIYLFPDRTPPGDFEIIDCIEFNERFRHADPAADLAFTVMDLTRLDRRDVARVLANAYFRAADDPEGPALLPFYTAYRAAVRAKVEGMKQAETEVPEAEQAEARQSAQAHWLVALGALEAPARRPCLVLVAGLPGTGKTTLSRTLAGQAGLRVIRSDLVRKELAGLEPELSAAAPFGEGLYAPARTEAVYAECRRRAEAILSEGGRVLVDASFSTEANRRRFLDLARQWGAPVRFLFCHADPTVVRRRLEGRRGDASDAGWSIYVQAAEHWEPPGEETLRAAATIATDHDRPSPLTRSLEILSADGLHQ